MEGALETVAGGRRYRTDEEKRRIVEGTLASGESVAVMARHYGVNANQLFHWRKQYQAGLLRTAKREGSKSEARFLPVSVSDDSPGEVGTKLSNSERPGTINIEFPGRALVSVEGQVEPAMIRAVLESLRG